MTMIVDSAVKDMANLLKLSKIKVTCNFDDEPTITVDLKDYDAATDIFFKTGFKAAKLPSGQKVLGTYVKGSVEVFMDFHQNFGYFQFKEL